VFGADGRLVGALSVSGPKPRFTPDTIASMTAQVLQGALRLTHALGGRNDAMGRAAEQAA